MFFHQPNEFSLVHGSNEPQLDSVTSMINPTDNSDRAVGMIPSDCNISSLVFEDFQPISYYFKKKEE